MNVPHFIDRLQTRFLHQLWFHRTGNRVARLWMNQAFTFRNWLGSSAGSPAQVANSEEHTEDSLGTFRRFNRDFPNIQGWFSNQSLAIWDSLLQFQRGQIITGDLFEIGTWKGKSATFLAMHGRQAESCIFVDRAILSEMRHSVCSVRAQGNVFLQCDSAELADRPEIRPFEKSCRWIHIDGEHSGPAVGRDLQVAAKLLGEGGVICVDDFPNDRYPQLVLSVAQFLGANPELQMFLTGFNKGYICRSEDAQRYRAYLKQSFYRDLSDRGCSEVTVWKSNTSDDHNCFGVSKRFKNFDYYGPDHSPHSIPI